MEAYELQFLNKNVYIFLFHAFSSFGPSGSLSIIRASFLFFFFGPLRNFKFPMVLQFLFPLQIIIFSCINMKIYYLKNKIVIYFKIIVSKYFNFFNIISNIATSEEN